MMTPEEFAHWAFWRRGASTSGPSPSIQWDQQSIEEVRNEEQAWIAYRLCYGPAPDGQYPAVLPIPQPDPLMAVAPTTMGTELARALEDYITTIIDSWDDTRQATAYLYLNRSGMTLDKARAIRVKAGMSE